MSPRLILIATALLASASALAQTPNPPPLGGGLPAPFPPNDSVSIAKALAHSAADLDKFISLNPKAQISQAQVTYQDDGYQVTITSQTCETPVLPELPPLQPVTVPDDALNPLPGGGLPLPPLVPVSYGVLPQPCKTYGMLVIQASADAEVQDGYTYQVLWNGTVRKK